MDDENARRELDDLLDLARDEPDRDALGREGANEIMDLALGADVDPVRRFVEDEKPRARGERTREEQLLLIAARQGRGADIRTARLHRQSRHEIAHRPPRRGVACARNAGRRLAHHADADVEIHGLAVEDRVAPAFRNEGDALAERGARVAIGDGAAVEADRAGSRLGGADHDMCDLGPPGADEPRHADNLARANVERDARKSRAAEAAHFEQRRAARLRLGRLRRFARLSAHVPYRAFDRQALDAIVGDLASVAHDDDEVGDRIDFAQAMADEDHGDAAVPQSADDCEQTIGFRLAETGVGLVEEERQGFADKRAGDLDELALRAGHGPHRAGRLEIADLQRIEMTRRLIFERGGAADEKRAPGEPRQVDVGRNRLLFEHLRLLMDDCDARAARIVGRAEATGRALDQHLAAIRPLGAREAGDQGRLARAVLAEQGGDPPRCD